MNVVQILRRARKLIQNPDDWCRYNLWDGHKSCAMGAILSVAGEDTDGLCNAVNVLTRALPGRFTIKNTIAKFNDTRRHDEVLALFDKAIASARPKRKTSIAIFKKLLQAPAPGGLPQKVGDRAALVHGSENS